MVEQNGDETEADQRDSEAFWSRTFPRVILALVMGTVGGASFDAIGMPLPWMLGALIFNTVAVVLNAPVMAPVGMRPYMVVIIGVMLGASFTSEILQDLGQWTLSVLFLAAYLAISGVLVVTYYRRVGKFDIPTAYFAGMPGGLAEMMIVGQEMGGDERRIILAHASRILITVVLLAIWFRFVAHLETGDRAAFGVPFAAIPAHELVILAFCGIVGFLAGRWLRLPAPMLTGPMLVSAVLHVTGHVSNPPPRELINAAQVFLGTIMGCRFLGSRPSDILRALLLSTGATMLVLAVSLSFALLFHNLFGQTVEQVLLAYAPGGVTEMSLIALAMGADVDYVALHHIARISIILMTAGILFRVLRKLSRN